jgi:hypothetical protein
MSPFPAVTKSESWTRMVRTGKKFLRWLLFLIVISLAVFIYFKYFFTYSEGYRAGLLQKFSNKGMIFKTYEGEMILSSVASTREVALASEKFLFSVTNKDIIRQFDTLQGRNVIVHYDEKRGVLFWRGDSRYLVDSVKLRK